MRAHAAGAGKPGVNMFCELSAHAERLRKGTVTWTQRQAVRCLCRCSRNFKAT